MLELALALAATTVSLSEAEIVDNSDLVARVTVLSAQAERVGRRIVTVYALEVRESWRGEAPREPVLLALPGGVVDGVGQHVPGTPTLAVGSEYVLCLSAPVLGDARALVGLWRGAWAVEEDGALRGFAHGPALPERVGPGALRARLFGGRQ
jgi:hypothetical protein